VQNVQASSSSEPGGESGFRAAAAPQLTAASAAATATTATATKAAATTAPAAKAAPVVHDGWEKTPRNAPCPCGSGKKYKMCHGHA
jgi:preprotein translocase subunit SecA